jgi:phosphoglycerate dehydrogenase-like enzyme
MSSSRHSLMGAHAGIAGAGRIGALLGSGYTPQLVALS